MPDARTLAIGARTQTEEREKNQSCLSGHQSSLITTLSCSNQHLHKTGQQELIPAGRSEVLFSPLPGSNIIILIYHLGKKQEKGKEI